MNSEIISECIRVLDDLSKVVFMTRYEHARLDYVVELLKKVEEDE